MTEDPLAEPVGLRADARRNRARVLRAAQEAFAAEGLSVPLDEIARRAGVGAGTVYRHFPTKEALFETIVIGRVREMGGWITEWAAAPDPGAAFFTMMTSLVENGAVKRDLIDALTAAGVDVSAGLTRERAEILKSMDVLLTRAQAAGAVRGDVDIDDLATLLGTLFLASARRGGVPNGVLTVVLDGLRA
jgi:AcrR family transcriptional regulator